MVKRKSKNKRRKRNDQKFAWFNVTNILSFAWVVSFLYFVLSWYDVSFFAIQLSYYIFPEKSQTVDAIFVVILFVSLLGSLVQKVNDNND